MHTQSHRLRAVAFLISVAALAFSDWASADPRSRALQPAGAASGVSFSPAGEIGWEPKRINQPMPDARRGHVEPRCELPIVAALSSKPDCNALHVCKKLVPPSF
jgi:hypothetical protein